ncbi:kinase-like protein, partial [Panus rudis PR-1116 ss-1]
LPLPFIKSVLHQAFIGLEFLHGMEIMHRTLKPATLLINAKGIVKIGDIDLAWMPKDDRTEVVTRFRGLDHVFERYYLPPELHLFDEFWSLKADIWAMGCILGEMVVKRPLFLVDPPPGIQTALNHKVRATEDMPFQADVFTKIMEKLGSPRETDWPEIIHLPGYYEMKMLGQYNTSLRNWWTPRIPDPLAGDLLEQLLAYNPDKRITAEDVLKHPWFQAEPLPKEK